MLIARQHQLPLPPALTSKIFDRRADQDVEVSSAAIWLEIENKGHRVATLYRSVKGLGDNRLIRVFENVTIDQAEKPTNKPWSSLRELRVLLQLEHGFDRWLAENSAMEGARGGENRRKQDKTGTDAGHRHLYKFVIWNKMTLVKISLGLTP